MSIDKAHFLRNELLPLLENMQPASQGNWGKMDAQQMIEHLELFFSLSYEKIHFPLSVPEEHLPKYQEFLYSEKPFRENTKAPANVLGEETIPTTYSNISEAHEKLQASVDMFFDFFKSNPGKKTMHPAFGMLNFEEWVMLHYKHVMHHLKQFSLTGA